MAPADPAPHHARPHLHRRAGRRNERRPCASRASPTPGPCPSRTASTCSPPACARRWASRSSAPTSPRSSGSAREIEARAAARAGTRSVFAERVGGGYFLDFDLKRDQLARYGLSVDDAQMVVMNAIGGENVSTTIEGRERYPINVRYYRDSRSRSGPPDRARWCPPWMARCRSRWPRSPT